MQESIKVESTVVEPQEISDALQKQSNLSDLATSDLKTADDHVFVLDIDDETKNN